MNERHMQNLKLYNFVEENVGENLSDCGLALRYDTDHMIHKIKLDNLALIKLIL